MANSIIEINSQLKEIKNELEALEIVVAPDRLYHYTSAEGLIGILASGNLRASHALFLNDPSELQYAFRVVNDILTRYPQNKELMLQLKQQESSDIYVACFCTNGNLLSQWRGYGDRGGGFSIGFNLKSFPDGLFLRKVIYNPQEQRRLANKVLEKYIAWSEQFSSFLEGNKSLQNKLNQYLSYNLFNCMLSFKDPGYQEEDEWRLIYINDSNHPIDIRERIRFRTYQNRIIPYIELLFNTQAEKSAIQEIFYGPSLESELMKKFLRLLLQKYDYHNISIFPSRIPYRG